MESGGIYSEKQVFIQHGGYSREREQWRSCRGALVKWRAGTRCIHGAEVKSTPSDKSTGITWLICFAVQPLCTTLSVERALISVHGTFFKRFVIPRAPFCLQTLFLSKSQKTTTVSTNLHLGCRRRRKGRGRTDKEGCNGELHGDDLFCVVESEKNLRARTRRAS